MKIKEFIINKYNSAGGPRDFIIDSNSHDNYLKPLHKELSKYGVEMTEIIFYAISIAANSDILETENVTEQTDAASGQANVFQIQSLDEDKIEFLMAVMIKLYGVDSLSNYKQMIKRLEWLAKVGLSKLHESFLENYIRFPDKFINSIVEGML